jgi:hypothetical protein
MENDIEVIKRDGDWVARIKGEPGVWAAGKTPEAAIGDLVNSNRERFNIGLISFPPK